MIILDPDRDGCTVWCVNSPFPENCISHIKGTPEEIVKTILPYITEYIPVRSRWGNRYDQCVLKDIVYIDQSPLMHPYVQIFNDMGFYIHTLPSKSVDTFKINMF